MSRFAALFLGTVWLLALVALDLAVVSRPEFLTRQVRGVLADTFGSGARCDGVRWVPGGDLVIEGLFLPNERTPSVPFIEIPATYFDFDWTRLLTGKSPLETVVFERPRITLRWNERGELIVESPIRATDGGEPTRLPILRTRGLDLRLVGAPTLFESDVWLRFRRADLELRQSALDLEAFELSAHVVDDLVGRVNVEGRLSRRGFEMHLDREGPPLAPKLLELLRPEVRGRFDGVRLGGEIDVYASVSLEREGPASVRIESRLTDVEIVREGWPQTLDRLGGRVVFEGGDVRLEGLTGRLEGAVLEVDGSIHLAGDGGLDISLRWKDVLLSEEFVDRVAVLPRPGPTVAEQLQAYAVRGPVDVTCDLQMTSFAGRMEPHVTISIADETFRYMGSRDARTGERRGVPMLLSELTGSVTLDARGLRFADVHGRSGLGLVTSEGWVDYQSVHSETWDVGVLVSRLPISDELFATMGERTGGFLSQLHLEGEGFGYIRPRHDRADVPAEVTIEALLFDGRARPDFFPYALQGLAGAVRWEQDDVILDDIRCPVGPGFVALEGRARTTPGRESISLRLRAHEVPLDRQLLDALAHLIPASAPLTRAVRVQGSLTADVQLLRTGASGPWSLRGRVELDGVALDHQVPRASLEIPRVVLTLNDGDVQLAEAVPARLNGIPITLDGKVKADGSLRVQAVTEDTDVGAAVGLALSTVFPPSADGEAIEVTGRGRFVFELELSGSSEAEETRRPRLSGSFAGLTVRPPGWPARIEDLRGHLIVEADAVLLRDVTAKIPWPVEVSPRPEGALPYFGRPAVELALGSGQFLLPSEESPSPRWHLSHFRLAGVPLAPWVFDAFGLPLEELDALGVPRLSGDVAVDLLSATWSDQRFKIYGGSCSARELAVAGGLVSASDVTISGLTAVLGRDAFEVSGSLLARGPRAPELGEVTAGTVAVEGFLAKLDRDGVRLSGRVTATDTTILSVPSARLTARLVGDGDGLSLDEVDGDVFGGSGGAAGRLDPSASRVRMSWTGSTFAADLRIEDVPLAAAVRSLGGDPGRFRGRGGLSLGVRGRPGDPGSLEGEGRFVGSASDLVEIPVFLSVFRALDVVSLFQMLVRSGVDTEIAVDLALKDRVVELSRVRVDNPAVTLDGRGSITFDGVVSAYLATRYRGGIPLLSDILNLIPSMVAGGVTVQGSLTNPLVTVRSGDDGREAADLPAARRPLMKPLKPFY